MVLDHVNGEQALAFQKMVLESPSVFLIGSGRSGLMVRSFAMRLGQLGLPAHLPGDILTPPIRSGHTLVVASGSGETGNLVAMANKSKDYGASIALVTANANSTLARMADCVVTLTAPPPKAGEVMKASSAQPMGSLFEQSLLIFFEAVILEMMRITGQDSATMLHRHANLE